MFPMSFEMRAESNLWKTIKIIYFYNRCCNYKEYKCRCSYCCLPLHSTTDHYTGHYVSFRYSGYLWRRGRLTHGTRSGNIALHAEFQGAIAVVLNAPTPQETIEYVKETIDIPVVVTVVSEHTDVQSRIEAGADILNVSGGSNGSDCS